MARTEPVGSNAVALTPGITLQYESFPSTRRVVEVDVAALAADGEERAIRGVGNIAVVYYFYTDAECRVATCELNVGFVSSTDGGATWTSQQFAGPFRTSWFPWTPSGYMDYVSVSFVDGNAIPIFAAASEGECVLGNVTSCNVWTASATIDLSLP